MSGDREDALSEPASENDFEEIGTGKEETSDDMMAEPKPVLDENGAVVTAPTKAKLDAKDPLRPRRKKARRACHACQRAHLTCGDERPCARCIKRNLQDTCKDGIRKKAKYLHDAPAEALGPVLGHGYQVNTNRSNDTHSINITTPTTSSSPGGMTGFFGPPQQSPSYPNQRFERPTPIPALQDPIQYASQQSPISVSTYQSPGDQRALQAQLTGSSTAAPDVQPGNPYTDPLFDPSNPAMYNFDLEGLNFGNQYGAMEFGMLGHMSSGVQNTPTMDKSMEQQAGADGLNYGPSSFNNLNQYGRMSYDATIIPSDFSADGGNMFGNGNLDMPGSHFVPHAYSIAAGPASLASPSTNANDSPQASGTFDSPTNTTYSTNTASQPSQAHPRPAKRQDNKADKLKFGPQPGSGKHKRDPSSIYHDVKEPYSYTSGFHSLTAFIQKRFSPSNTLRIAKALASIRPSFISCTKTLNKQDLIFMEKCFQRTLFEYEDFMIHCCTPTLVCRRTGEIAAVNKEFTLLTGWTKEVLLGQAPNNNVNTGGDSGRSGIPTPRKLIDRGQGPEPAQHSVFLAELFDDDSVIRFYENFAKLAFGDSRGSVTDKCRLLTYQTQDSLVSQGDSSNEIKVKLENAAVTGEVLGKRKADQYESGNDFGNGHHGANFTKIDGVNGFGKKLGKDGKMECIYCWTVKRDVFDIPMLIVMNFLPVI